MVIEANPRAMDEKPNSLLAGRCQLLMLERMLMMPCHAETIDVLLYLIWFDVPTTTEGIAHVPAKGTSSLRMKASVKTI
jgi:hypothetical protein